MQEKEQLKVQLNELRAKQTEEGEQQELESLKQELQEAKETVRVAVEREESLQEELERERQRCEDFEKKSLELKEKLEKLKDVYDLQYYRAVEAEQKRAEEREKQLRETLPTLESQKMVEDLEELQEKQLIMQQKRAGGAISVSPPLHKSLAKESSVSGVVVSERTMSKRASIEPDQLSQVLLAQQLPPIPKFSGEDRSQGAETFRDWKEQFEMVASLAGWDERAKLVNLTARLRGQAFGFYRSCTLSQRASYESLVKELEKRFTPVELPAVQTSLFHDRKQKQGESVDDYAQDLRYLFYQAYPKAQQGSSEAEKKGKSVLANQFVNGLIPELKAKITGKEGDVEQLLAYARFEEAKLRDSGSSQRNPSKQSVQSQFRPTYRFSGGHRTEGQTPTGRRQLPTFTDGQQSGTQLPQRTHSNRYRDIQCYICRRYGHLARHCKFGIARGQQEARGPPHQQPSRNQIAKVTTDNPLSQPNLPNAAVNSDHSPSESHSPELENVLESVGATLHSLSSSHSDPSSSLGPTLTSKVILEDVSVDALLDTGSPVTIASLDFIVKALAARKPASQTKEEWKADVRKRIEKSTMKLHNYGGDELSLTGQIKTSISRGQWKVEAVIQVQNKAPVDLLIGTDLLPVLGFALVEQGGDGIDIDLITKSPLKPCDSPKTTPGDEGSIRPVDCECNEESISTPVVRLVQAVKLPARHGKILKARIDGQEGKSPLLFEPDMELCNGLGLSVADSFVETDENNLITLLVENKELTPTHLDGEQQLGKVTNAALQDPTTLSEEELMPPVAAVMYQTEASPQESVRIQQIVEQVQFDQGNLSSCQLEQLHQFLAKYKDVFALSGAELGVTDLVTHSINTSDHPPIRQPVRRTPFSLRKTVEELTQEMLDQDVIQPSHSPWASPIVLVKKPDGSMRFCVDYRQLNSITKMDVYPLPRIDDTLSLLSGAKYFSTLDLASGYWQVKMSPESIEKTAFVTHSGLYEFKKMPFGLCNAPATFQRLMELVLQGLTRSICMIYLDDILIFSRTFTEHISHLTQVFDRLHKANLRLKPRKCRFGQSTVNYLGHVVSEKGIAVDPKKMEAVQNFPCPKNLKTLKSFLGLASYYRRFVPNFSKVAGPLYSLTKKNSIFTWTSTCQEVFEKLKHLLTNTPVLAFPDFTEGFLLETDASSCGLGAVLSQKINGVTHPISYASRTLQPHESNYGATELEALGVVWAVKHFRPYLYGHHCDVFTDHSALTSLLNTPQPSGKLARWGLALQDLDLKIQHRAGKENQNADCLSRHPTEGLQNCTRPSQLVAATEVSTLDSETEPPKLRDVQQQDASLIEIFNYKEKGELPLDDHRARELVIAQSQYEIVEDVLYHVEPDKTLRLVLPETSRRRVFDEVHGGRFGGHLRDAKIHGELSRHYWWPTMRADIRRWCKECIICASRRVGHMVKPPLTPIPVSGPFDRVGVDVIQFPKSYDGNQYAIVFMDYLTKWPEVYPVPDQTAHTIARTLVEGIISRHGVPTELLSDRGRNFLSDLMREVYHLMGIHKVSTTAYHPQSDGLVERFNRTLTDMLSKVVDRQGRDWDKHLPYVLFAYRACPQEFTRESPFFLLYGRDPRLPTEEALTQPRTRYQVDLDDYKTELTDGLTTAWNLAQNQIRKSQQRQKKYYDRSAGRTKISVGDRVFLYVPSAKTGKAHKFARPFHGPYRVLEVTSNDARIVPVHTPKAEPIFVALDRIRLCPKEIPFEVHWPPQSKSKSKGSDPLVSSEANSTIETPQTSDSGNWSARLRKRN